MSEDQERFDTVVDETRNVLCFTTTENVVDWLKERPKIRAGFWVRVGDVEGYMSVTDYLRDQGASDELTVEQIRQIIREELKSLVEALGDRAYAMDGHGTGELESAGLQAIKSVMEDQTRSLPHGWKCPRRFSGYKNCDCGVGNDG